MFNPFDDNIKPDLGDMLFNGVFYDTFFNEKPCKTEKNLNNQIRPNNSERKERSDAKEVMVRLLIMLPCLTVAAFLLAYAEDIMQFISQLF